MYPHDLVLGQLEHRISDKVWLEQGSWSSPKLTRENRELLEDYRL